MKLLKGIFSILTGILGFVFIGLACKLAWLCLKFGWDLTEVFK